MPVKDAVPFVPVVCPYDGSLMTSLCVCEGCDVVRAMMKEKEERRAQRAKALPLQPPSGKGEV